ncbi:MAG: hypothetical protein Q7T03_02420 [Deltaproteobacteria bacterium]|nr:hypothetical protein [Deltaproteobacteria bacterium]
MKIKNCWAFDVWILGLLAGCGSSSDLPTGVSFSETTGETGYVQLNVSNSRNVTASKNATIDQYRITIRGDGLEPIENTVTANADGALIQGVPVFKSATVTVAALNADKKILREGIAENVSVAAGQTAAVSVVLDSVPVLLNLSDGDHTSNQRLWFHLLTDPGHFVAVEEDRPLKDVSTSLSQIVSGEQGESRFYPGSLLPGEHHFILRDNNTGKTSAITLHLWDGAKIKGAPLFAASSVQLNASAIISKRLGQSITGEVFPKIVEALWNTR